MKLFATFSFILLFAFSSFSQSEKNSTFGGPFTPHGDMRFLVIFAGYEDDCDPASPIYNHAVWPQENPDQGKDKCATFPDQYETLFYTDFSEFSPENTDRSLSNYFYQMSRKHPSNPPMRVVADFFPEKINIKGNRVNNYEVFKTIQEKYPDFNWSRYDLRTNNPQFKFRNDTSASDHIIDYVIVFWRGLGLNGYASVDVNFPFITQAKGVKETYNVSRNCGFTIINSLFHLPGIKSLFLHELAHTLYNAPHMYGANGVLGSYFYCSNGWGMMNYENLNTCANAWESWYLGWIEIPEEWDLEGPEDNGIYTLRDFASTGEAIRIKIPGTEQRLWLENHAGKTPFDDRESWHTDGMGQPTPMPEKGLYAFVEAIATDRNTIINALSLKYSNGLKAIDAAGNHDYISLKEEKDQHIFGNISPSFQKIRKNPASAHNSLASIRLNYASDTLYPDMIFHRTFTNNRDEALYLCGKKFPFPKANEYYPIYYRDGSYTYEYMGTNMAFSDPGDKIGLSVNPMIVNLQKYDPCNEILEPVILHGLSITILNFDSTSGDIKFEVKFDDTEINNHQRFSGNLLIKDISFLDKELVIGNGKTVRLDKSGTPNRHSMGKKVNEKPEFPDFITPTLLTIDSSAFLEIKENGKLIVEEGSSLLIKDGGKLKLNPKSTIIISKNSYFGIENADSLILDDAVIRFRKGARTGTNPLLKIKSQAFQGSFPKKRVRSNDAFK